MKNLVLTLAFTFVVLIPAFAQANKTDETERVKQVLNSYKKSIEALDATKTTQLFTSDSKVYESGGVEGTYAQYLDHHLGPELKVFKSFNFSDYKVDVDVDGPYAFATETYVYTIVLAKDGSTIKKKGVATSILKNVNGEWKIVNYHSSSRNQK